MSSNTFLKHVAREAGVDHQLVLSGWRRAKQQDPGLSPISWADQAYPHLRALLVDPSPRQLRQYLMPAARRALGLPAYGRHLAPSTADLQALFPGLRLPAGQQAPVSVATRHARGHGPNPLLDAGFGGGPGHPVTFVSNGAPAHAVLLILVENTGVVSVGRLLDLPELHRFQGTDVGRGGVGNPKTAFNAEVLAGFGVDLTADLNRTLRTLRSGPR